MGTNDNGRYIFGITGTIKEIIYPSKAIVTFKFNGKEEKAILLVHKMIVDGCHVDEHKLMSDIVKAGDILEFDGHIYDKGGFGNSKDRCNYYAMRAWKASQSKVVSKEQMMSSKAGRPPLTIGTGWISEIFPRKGVLTFNNNGQDERVLFLASKVYIFEKRLGTKQSLDQVLSEGDPVQFEAVPQDSSDNPYYCSWFASLIWKGKRPPCEEPAALNSANILSVTGRRGSIGSTGSSESISTEGSSDSMSSPLIPRDSVPSSPISQVIRGKGFIARIVDESCGLIWWMLRPNHFQSVWFDRKHTFLFGMNLSNHDLGETFKQGDPVNFIAARSSSGPTNWEAKQVLVTEGGGPDKFAPPQLAVGGPIGILG
jgi:hypothetical protein